MEFRASRWGGMLSWTKLLMPDTITLGEERICVVKKQFFGLKDTTEELSFSKVSSVRLKNGFFFSDVIVESAGGATADVHIKTIKKPIAKKLVGIINGKIA